jgi:hypothetical protein
MEIVLTSTHCSNHLYRMAGCSDCDLLKIRVKHGIHHLQIDHGTPSPKLQLVRQQLQAVLSSFLRKAAKKAASAAEQKAAEVIKADEDELMQILYAANGAVDWEEIVDSTTSELKTAYEDGGKDGIAQLAISHNLVPDMTDKVVSSAEQYAKKRAAEMVGKKFIDGELIGDSNAEWVIAETTRDDLKDIIEMAVTQKMSSQELATAIQEAGTFSEARAELIAKTEIALAQVQGNLDVWKLTGFVKTVSILLSADHDIVDECDDAAAGGPYPIDDMPFVPRHPRCKCVIIATEISE